MISFSVIRCVPHPQPRAPPLHPFPPRAPPFHLLPLEPQHSTSSPSEPTLLHTPDSRVAFPERVRKHPEM
ncbi:hypothetical protein E2C01_085067 [Portunus trituberculatus]|uniref:Uncharacterized protein n=1 Tax=Portunus trituberculatus TaxID=210409 RepID=A0A5B7J000_PORTR|nr:hypothetical protein [Portunus trituberculatus]